MAFFVISSRSLQEEQLLLTEIETLAVKIPLILLESGHSSACMMEELKDCYEMKTAKLSLNIILQKCCS